MVGKHGQRIAATRCQLCCRLAPAAGIRRLPIRDVLRYSSPVKIPYRPVSVIDAAGSWCLKLTDCYPLVIPFHGKHTTTLRVKVRPIRCA